MEPKIEQIQRVPSQEEILALLKESDYLNTSFEGQETHLLSMLPLSKEEAYGAYRKSGDNGRISQVVEENISYATPNAENLDVMIMDSRVTDIADLDSLGVRPLTFEEFIQYGIQHPSHQEKVPLVTFDKGEKLILFSSISGRWLDSMRYGNAPGGSSRCLLVARK